MKLQLLFSAGLALLLVAWAGCDGAEFGHDCADCRKNPINETPLAAEIADNIRKRADAAFDRSIDERTRFESRIGPQPWPRGLPVDWPKPSSSRVMADTNSRDDGRLLLVDLSGSLEEAIASYQTALRDVGFQVERTDGGDRHNTFRARRDDVNAILQFFARADSTRLEILFMADPQNPAG